MYICIYIYLNSLYLYLHAYVHMHPCKAAHLPLHVFAKIRSKQNDSWHIEGAGTACLYIRETKASEEQYTSHLSCCGTGTDVMFHVELA